MPTWPSLQAVRKLLCILVALAVIESILAAEQIKEHLGRADSILG